MKKMMKVIISGGGTGGHVFPAIAIARELKKELPATEILFVGALGRLEMTKVPEAGFRIEGLPVRGFNRKNLLKNVSVVADLMKSMKRARAILRWFTPDVVVGVGGYASGPVGKAAGRAGIPVVIQEQNSYAGVTNRLLAKYAVSICVAYEGMEKYFPTEKIILTGNPVREEILASSVSREEAFSFFGIPRDHEVILALGGSLGAGSVNKALMENAEMLRGKKVFLLWQTGRGDYEDIKKEIKTKALENVQVTAFIEQMEMAYAAAEVIISRAGAGTISELAVVGKSVILVPSPNVAEDHQTKNALALTQKEAALMVRDDETTEKLPALALELLGDEERRKHLSANLQKLARPEATKDIVREIIKAGERRT
jgi:UDP-N-acetylglucosamine--N-acetylmuramyl-(pentapeptide) pyrophosphoryl-undecaprenol N-acetylglucosamine transferase